MSKNSKRIAIIGAGVSGLCSTKSCLESGVTPVCFEQSSDIGGLWRYKSEPTLPGEGSVMKCTTINTSKEMMAFSDFPPPSHFHTFMHHSEVFQYLQLYAEHFNLLPHIKLHHQIRRIERSEDYASTGTWKVSYVDLKDPNETVHHETFDGVLLCAGHHTYPYQPSYPDQDRFRGEVLHAKIYRTNAGYMDKTVVVVGMGNSAGDIAVELGHHVAKKVYLSARRNTWIYNRSLCGSPYDMVIFSRLFFIVYNRFPRFVNYFMEKELSRQFDYSGNRLRPSSVPLSTHPTVNDVLLPGIISGAIIRKPPIARFKENGVVFTDGSEAVDVDVVIFGTGYTMEYPFLEEGVMSIAENDVDLYKYIYPPHLKHRTIGVIGMIQPYGAIQPIAEMQTRLFLKVFNGEATLPSEKAMMEDITAVKHALHQRYVASRRHTFQVDGVPYMDSLARMIQVEPPSPMTLIQSGEWTLLTKIYAEGTYPYQYRLRGPNSWPGARKAILGAKSRSFAATTGKPEAQHEELYETIKSYFSVWTRVLYGKLLHITIAFFLVILFLLRGYNFLLSLIN